MPKLFGREWGYSEPPLTEEEKQTQESREDYKKRAAERAKEITQHYRIVYPKRKYRELTKEEIVRFDAKRENKARNLAGQDKKFENQLEFERDTDLILGEKMLSLKENYRTIRWLEGKIKGKKIKIDFSDIHGFDPEACKETHRVIGHKVTGGVVDGQEITLELAQKIFNKYYEMIKEKEAELNSYFRKTHLISDPEGDEFLKEYSKKQQIKSELEKRSDQIAKDIGFNS